MAHGFSNRVWADTATTGTGDVTVGSAKPAHCTPAQAGTQDGDERTWLLEEGNDFEIFRGAYTASGSVVTRGTVLLSQIAGSTGATRMTLAGSATIREVVAAEDLLSIVDPRAARGVLGILSQPQGRLTLQSGVPVMSTTQSAKTTLYYSPYVGNQIPINDGVAVAMTTFSEISIATTDTTYNPAAIGAGKVNDWFVWDDGGTLRLSHGPDWTNDTTRSAGTALTISLGFLTNSVDITNGPLAGRGTYVGTTRSNGSSQLDWIFGASGTAPWFGLWNMYNRVEVSAVWADGQSSWTYASTTTRALNNRAIARVSFVRGLNEDGVSALAQTYVDGNSGSAASFGWGLDSASVNTTQMQATAPSVAGIGSVQYAGLPGVGFHFLQQTEKSSGAVSYTAWGVAGLSSITFNGRM